MRNCRVILYGPVAQLVSAPPCHGGGRGFKSRQGRGTGSLSFWTGSLSRSDCFGSVAQLVERSTENRKVTGSTPVGATLFDSGLLAKCLGESSGAFCISDDPASLGSDNSVSGGRDLKFPVDRA